MELLAVRHVSLGLRQALLKELRTQEDNCSLIISGYSRNFALNSF